MGLNKFLLECFCNDNLQNLKVLFWYVYHTINVTQYSQTCKLVLILYGLLYYNVLPTGPKVIADVVARWNKHYWPIARFSSSLGFDVCGNQYLSPIRAGEVHKLGHDVKT